MSLTQRSHLKLVFCLLFSLGISVLLWLGQPATLPPSLAQTTTPIFTPVTGDIFMYAHRTLVPPTPTSTRIPDDEPPVTTLVITGAKNIHDWYRAPVTFTFYATDNWAGLDVTWYNFTDGWDWYAHPYYFPPVVMAKEGRRNLRFYSEDKNFNAEDFQIAPLNIDLTPPTVSHTLAGLQLPNGWYTRSVTITFTGQDNLSGVDYYEVNLNNNGWFAKTSPYRISSTGYYTLAYRAVDRAGNGSLVGIVRFGVEGYNEVYLPLLIKR